MFAAVACGSPDSSAVVIASPTPATTTAREPTTTGTAATSPGGQPDGSGSIPNPMPSVREVDACALIPAEKLTEIVGEQMTPSALPRAGWAAGMCAFASPSAAFVLG